jgi:ribosome-associated protein
MSTDAIPSLDLYIKAASEKKALNLIVLDVRDLTSIADVFIICSGRSNRQVNAIADSIVAKLKKHEIKPLSVEGTGVGHWILLDYGHVVIHVFYEPVREFFDLEGLWVDAKRITTPGTKKSKSSSKTPNKAADI